jgi:hypothetical protein
MHHSGISCRGNADVFPCHSLSSRTSEPCERDPGPNHRFEFCEDQLPRGATERFRGMVPRFREDDIAYYLPGQLGLRFSANAFSPSLASSVIAKSAIWLSV